MKSILLKISLFIPFDPCSGVVVVVQDYFGAIWKFKIGNRTIFSEIPTIRAQTNNLCHEILPCLQQRFPWGGPDIPACSSEEQQSGTSSFRVSNRSYPRLPYGIWIPSIYWSLKYEPIDWGISNETISIFCVFFGSN